MTIAAAVTVGVAVYSCIWYTHCVASQKPGGLWRTVTLHRCVLSFEYGPSKQFGVRGFYRPLAIGWPQWQLPRISDQYAYTNDSMSIIWIALPLTVAALWMWFVHIRRRNRFGAGKCVQCGYDLSGSAGGVCPECGEKAEVG